MEAIKLIEEALKKCEAEQRRIMNLALFGTREENEAEFRRVIQKHEDLERAEYERLKERHGP